MYAIPLLSLTKADIVNLFQSLLSLSQSDPSKIHLIHVIELLIKCLERALNN